MKRLLIALAGLSTVLAAGDLPRGAVEATLQTQATLQDSSGDNEEPPVAPHGLHFRWPAPAATLLTRVAEPVLPLDVVNLDDVAYVLQIRTREDAGSLQTRRVSEPVLATVAARGSAKTPSASAPGCRRSRPIRACSRRSWLRVRPPVAGASPAGRSPCSSTRSRGCSSSTAKTCSAGDSPVGHCG